MLKSICSAKGVFIYGQQLLATKHKRAIEIAGLN